MDKLTDYTFDWSQEPWRLRRHYENSGFDEAFYEFISKRVLRTLSPQLLQEPHNLNYDDQLVHSRLIAPLERFIFGLGDDAPQEEVDKMIDHLKTLRQPTKMCHKVLKAGDVLFSCNDCGFDATCVLCIECFHKSAHKEHNYRMSNTDGGGCCDCGDIEAWKQFPACSEHEAPDQPSPRLEDFEDAHKRKIQLESDRGSILDKIEQLPAGMAARYFLVCQASLYYARLLLLWNAYDSLPPGLTISESQLKEDEEEQQRRRKQQQQQQKNARHDNDGDAETAISLRSLVDRAATSRNWFTVLFNDEIHTYDYVIDQLTKIIKCSKMTASIIAAAVSREGRCYILRDQYKPCTIIRDAIACHRENGQTPLKVEVIHGCLLAHQAYALKLVEWIKSTAALCDGFRVLTAYTLLGPDKQNQVQNMLRDDDMSLLEQLMYTNTDLWKMARIDWNELFVSILLTEYTFKDKFARLLTREYENLVENFIRDDHDHSVSILTMTTQLYTVPSLVCMLIEEELALKIIADMLCTLCHDQRRDANVSYEARVLWDAQSLRRGFYIISDFRHLISIQPTKWTDGLRAAVIKGAKSFLDMLDSMQCMDSVRRQIGQHIEYEQDWETGMQVQSRLIHLITQLVKYCSYDELVLTALLRETQLKLVKDGGYKRARKTLFGHSANCIQYDVSTMSVSIHLPLTRFAAALILELMQRRRCASVPYDESLVILTPQGFGPSMIDIMELSLRTEVMIGQFRSGMWRRNGYSLVNQIIYFSGSLMRKEMYDRDILLLQECAATCDANEFMIHLLNKFNLFNWVTSETTREPLTGPKAVSFYNDEEILTQTMSLGEEFLQILLTIIGERYLVGVGKVSEEDVNKNEIIQLLCISPYTRSEIAHKLYANDHEIDCVKQVANLKRTGESSTGKYELKEEFYDRFNPFFYHYSRRHQSQALNAQLKRKRTAKEPLICCPPPVPVELCDQFRNLNELLICDITLTIVQKILHRALGMADSSLNCSTKAPIRFMASDLQLDQCLHLIGLGLHEQARRPFEFDYIDAIYSKQIVSLLKDCYENAKRSTDLIFWLMQKTNEIIETMETQPGYATDANSVRAQRYAQIRQLYKPILTASDTVKQENQRSNSELAAKRRERIMAMMKAKQNSFMSNPETQQLAAETAKHEAQGQLSRRPRAKASARSSSSFAALRERAAATAASASASTSTGGQANTTPTIMEYELGAPSQPQQPQTPVQDEAMVCEFATAESEDNWHERDCGGGGSSKPGETSSGSKQCDPQIQQPEDFVAPSHLCILCRDEQVVAFDNPTMVLLAYVQRSAVLSKNRRERRIPNYSLTPSNQLKNLHLTMTLNKPLGSAPEKYSFTSDNSWSFDATFMPADLFFGPHVSTCGHVMHYDCWKGFYDNITKRETSRPNRGIRHVSFELEKAEILCPLCECISNATIPLIPDYTTFADRHSPASPEHQSQATAETTSVFGVGASAIEDSAERLTAFLHALKGTVATYKHIRHLSQQPNSPAAASTTQLANNHETGKYMRLLQPTPINDVLKDLDEREAFALRDFIASTRAERLCSTSCSRTLLNSIQTLADRIHCVGLDLDKSITDVHHARVFMMTSWAISYTIQANERALRFRGSPLFDDLDSSKSLCLSSLVRFANSSMMVHQPDMIQSLLIQKLRYLLVGEEHLAASPSCLDIDAFELFVSIFIMLQRLYSHIPEETNNKAGGGGSSGGSSGSSPSSAKPARTVISFFSDPLLDINMQQQPTQSQQPPAGAAAAYAWTTRNFQHEYFRNLLHLTVIMNLIQVSITIQNDIAAKSMRQQAAGAPETTRPRGASDHAAGPAQDTASKEYEVMQNFFRDIILASGHPCNAPPQVDEKFISCVKRALLPFLRSCAIFLYQLSHVPPGELLTKSSAFNESQDFAAAATTTSQQAQQQQQQQRQRDEDRDRNKTDAEFEAICHYLSLPTDFSILLRSKEARNLALTWLRHSRVLPLIKSSLEQRQQEQEQEQEAQLVAHRPRQEQEAGRQQQQQVGFSRASSSSSLQSAVPACGTSSSQQQPQLQIPQQSELMPVKLIRQPHSVNRLIDLPYDYSELVDMVSNFTCPSIKNEDSRTPTMCLVCGVMLCSQSYCCTRDLNDLAANYKQVLRRQEENRKRWVAADWAAPTPSGSSSSSAGSSTPSASGSAGSSTGAAASGPGAALGVEGLSPAQAQQMLSAAAATAGNESPGAQATMNALLSSIQMAFGPGGVNNFANPTAVGAAIAASMRSAPEEAGRSALSSISTMLLNTHSVSQLPVGSCTYHAHECSGGVGVFLRIRNCQILLLSGRSKGCYMPAPYIDDHGETDFGLMRGNPLHLNREFYERLQSTWMNHTIPEQISRTLEYSPHTSSIHWYLH